MRSWWNRWFTDNTTLGKIAFVFGLFIFTPGVIGLLLWLHLFGQPVVEDISDFVPAGIVLATGTPQWAFDGLDGADRNLPDDYRMPHTRQGVLYAGYGDTSKVCSSDWKGELIQFPCRPGWVTLTLWDQKIASCNDDDCEVAVAFPVGDPVSSCTIMVPPSITLALPAEADTTALPVDVEEKVLAHEYLHCLGKQHVYTPIFGPFISRPTGHLMHPSVYGLGWSSEGM